MHIYQALGHRSLGPERGLVLNTRLACILFWVQIPHAPHCRPCRAQSRQLDPPWSVHQAVVRFQGIVWTGVAIGVQDIWFFPIALRMEVCGPRYSVLEYGPAYAADSTLVPEAEQGTWEPVGLVVGLRKARSIFHTGWVGRAHYKPFH